MPWHPPEKNKDHASWRGPVSLYHCMLRTCLEWNRGYICVIYYHWTSFLKVWCLFVAPETGFHRTYFGKHSPGKKGSFGGMETAWGPRRCHLLQPPQPLESLNSVTPEGSHRREKVGWSIKWGHPCLVQGSSPPPQAWNSAGHSVCSQQMLTEWT